MRTGAVYPFRRSEKLLALALPVLMVGALALRSPVEVKQADERWQICLSVGPVLIHCWYIGDQPKQLAPDVPAGCCSDTCVGPCQ